MMKLKKLSWKKYISSSSTEIRNGFINGINFISIITVRNKKRYYCIFVNQTSKDIVGVHGNEGYTKYGRFYDLDRAKNKCYEILNESIQKLFTRKK